MSLDSYIAKQFSHPEGVGGQLITFVMNRQNRPLYEETIRLLPLSDVDSVLDIGCGNGYVLSMIAERSGCMLTGIDISTSIIDAASRRNHSFVANGRMKLIRQDIGKTSFDDCSFSKAYTINTVYFWENLSGTMAEIRRILKPKALFINTFYSIETLARLSHTQFGYKQFTLDQLTGEGTDAGFTVNVVPILNGVAYSVLYHRVD